MRRKGEGSGSRLLLCQEFAMGDENFVVQALLSVHTTGEFDSLLSLAKLGSTTALK